MGVKQIFVNLPIKELERSVDFFTALGFEFNPQFTDDKAACLILGEGMYAMLLTEGFFQTFTSGRAIADTETTIEVLTALALESREEVDEMIDKVIEAGGSEFRAADDYGWMYTRSFRDLDGHIWEPFYADESQAPESTE